MRADWPGATRNLQHPARTLRRRRPVDPDRFADAVRAARPDVLALQEVDLDQPRSPRRPDRGGRPGHGRRRPTGSSPRSPGHPGATWMAATGPKQPGTAAYGIALLSRYPATAGRCCGCPGSGAGPDVSARAGVAIVREEPRAAVVARLDTPLGPLTVANTHLSFVPGWNRVQLRRLVSDLRGFPGPRVLMGDLNMTPPRPQR